MRRAAKVDANQSAIVAALRQAGCSVQPIHMIGQGAPDLIVGFETNRDHRVNLLIELKDGAKSPSDRRLTADEEQWHRDWRGQVAVIDSIDAAIHLIGTIKATQ